MDIQKISIDLTYLNTVTEGNQKFAKTLLTSAVKDIDIKIASLVDSWENNDAAGLRRAAHSLISLSAIAGVPSVSGWCRTLEHAFKETAFRADMAPFMEKIIGGWSDAQPELMKLIVE